jgi:hypothetical protein
MNIHNNWREFLSEGSFKEKKLLREITEDELEHIRKALDEMGPEDLAFNDLFDGKNRILIPFPTRDAASELGKFVLFFDETGWQVDWEKGIISGVKEFLDTSPAGQGYLDQQKSKKMQMKIGKFFSKMKSMVDKYLSLRREVKVVDTARQRWEDALGEEKTEQYYKLYDRMNGLLGNDIILMHRFTKDHPNYVDSLARYWQLKADYIKKNLSSLDENKYSIIITRHPVDVLRMSDFDDITSCHSPPSRPQGEGSYYKCAVAEAHGHGALAYVVNNSDLEEEFGTGKLRAIEESSAFQDNQDLFYDEARDAGAEIEPVSRLRLRQVRHYETERPKRYDEGTQIAVPEKRVYGVKVPGFREKVMEWARTNQQEAMMSAPQAPTEISGPATLALDQFIKYGGSYEDNNIKDLVRDIYNDERFVEVSKFFHGHIKQDTSTQRELEKTLVLTNMNRVQREAEEIMENYNLRHFEIELEYDEEEGNAFIIPTVRMRMDFDADEWIAGKNSRTTLTYLPREFEDYGDDWDIFGTGEYDTYASSHITGRVRMRVATDKLGDMGTWMNSGDLDELMAALYDIEGRKYAGFKMIATGYLMREGVLDGGEVDRLGAAVENDDLDSGDWELETEEGDHEPHRYELVTANMRLEISFENTTVEMLKKIVEEREFWLGIRTIMTKKSRGLFAVSNYQVDTDRFFDGIDEERKILDFQLNYHIGAGDNDNIAKTWKAIIETWNDEEELSKMIQDQFNKWVRAYSGPVVKNAKGERMVETKLRLRNRTREQRTFDKWRRFLKQI